MPAVPFYRLRPPPASVGWRARLLSELHCPMAGVEAACWLAVAAVMIGLRWWLAVHLPTYIWSRDSGSYLTPAFGWLQTGQWITNPRRGPVYSLFLAWVFKAGGTLTTVANLQAVLGAMTALATVAMARVWLGRRAFAPLLFCAGFYALYGMPVELERLIRNETLLAAFSTMAFGGWFFALKTGSRGWMAFSGLFSGLLHLLKGIFPIFPLIVVVLTAWNWRRGPWRASLLAACYVAPFLLPLIASKSYDRLSGTRRPPEPEAGEMLYGRTAQWTYLDGGIVPDIKDRIRPLVEAYAQRYRKTSQLDNNEIVKRTVVPALKTVLVNERGGQLVDVDRLCRRLALEAIAHHPFPYLRQASHDFYYLNFITAQRFELFLPKPINDSARDARKFCAAQSYDQDSAAARIFVLEKSQTIIHAASKRSSPVARFSHFILLSGHLRLLSPVFLTSIFLPLLLRYTRGRERQFWLGMTMLWFYYLLLLSTVGRPLDRYMMPVVPLMFWAVATAFARVWPRLLERMTTRAHVPVAAAASVDPA